jgi:hypothetical protein
VQAHGWVLKDIQNVDEWTRLSSPSGEEDGDQPSPSWVKSAKMKFLKLIPGNR